MVLKKGSYPTKKPPDGGGSKKQSIKTSSYDFTSNYAALEDFKAFAASCGLIIPAVEADGKIHRLRGEGDKPGTKSYWYVYFSYPVAVGVVGSWRKGESYTWCIKSGKQLDDAEREALKQQYHQARRDSLAGSGLGRGDLRRPASGTHGAQPRQSGLFQRPQPCQFRARAGASPRRATRPRRCVRRPDPAGLP